jgi:hypothetical protein
MRFSTALFLIITYFVIAQGCSKPPENNPVPTPPANPPTPTPVTPANPVIADSVVAIYVSDMHSMEKLVRRNGGPSLQTT